MSYPDEETKQKLINALDLYNEDKYEFERRAYNDDNVLIKKSVKLNDVLASFDLINKKFYKDYVKIINVKNNITEINKLKEKNKQYTLFTIKYYLNNYDYGNDKYNRLDLEELEETYKYDVEKKKYKRQSYLSGGNLKHYNLTYNDLIDDTYKTIESVVNKIKALESIIPKAKSLNSTPTIERSLSQRRSLPLLPKNTRTPKHANLKEHSGRMAELGNLLDNLPDDLSNMIKLKAYLQKKVEEKIILDNSYKNVILEKTKSTLSLKEIIDIFELNHFNYNEKDEYKDDNKAIQVKCNEEVLVDISSSIAGDTDFTHMFCYKTIKLDKDRNDKYEIILAYIPLNDNINDNNDEEYIRKTYNTEQEKNNVIPKIVIYQNRQSIIQQLQGSAINLENLTNILFNTNNTDHTIKDEYNPEIIKKLKYKDLINIFNPDIEYYDKVIKKLNNIPKSSSASRRKLR